MDSASPERSLHVERVDDLPVLFACLQRLGVAELLDRQFHNHEHHFWKGELTFGEVVSVWVAFVLSQGDHRLSRLEPWAREHQLTLQALLGKPVRALDFHDDRLADVLDCLPQGESWQAFEADLNGHAVRVYDLDASLIRIDTTTANSYASVLSDHGLIQFGHSKDRADLPQLKVALAALDPLGMPLTTVALPGNCADDPVYVPEIRKVQQALGRGGKTYVSDCKGAAVGTRAYLASTGDYYVCPLPLTVVSREQRRLLLGPVWQGKQALQEVRRPASEPGEPDEVVARGFAFDVALEAKVGGKWVRWTERRWLVQSVALARSQRQQLGRRLQQAQEQLEQLGQRQQGKKRLTADQMQAAADDIVRKQRVDGLLGAQVQTTTQQRRLRRYGDRPEQVVVEQEHRVEVWRDDGAVDRAKREMGWHVYAANQLTLPLAGVVWAYRGQYRVEDDWSRLKGRPLSLTPLYLSSERRMQGLVLLLSIALRVLTLLEWVVRRKLAQGEEKLKGLYPGQAGRQTDRPSAELLLRAFRGISLVIDQVAGQVRRLLTPLNALQKRLLALWDLPSDLYARLELHFAEPPPH
jgi:transposase